MIHRHLLRNIGGLNEAFSRHCSFGTEFYVPACAAMQRRKAPDLYQRIVCGIIFSRLAFGIARHYGIRVLFAVSGDVFLHLAGHHRIIVFRNKAVLPARMVHAGIPKAGDSQHRHHYAKARRKGRHPVYPAPSLGVAYLFIAASGSRVGYHLVVYVVYRRKHLFRDHISNPSFISCSLRTPLIRSRRIFTLLCESAISSEISFTGMKYQ